MILYKKRVKGEGKPSQGDDEKCGPESIVGMMRWEPFQDEEESATSQVLNLKLRQNIPNTPPCHTYE
jgi:hypothetical protein